MRRAIVAWERTPTNVALARAADWLLLDPLRAQSTLGAGDTALARLDVRRTLDGVEVGFEALGRLSAQGVTVLNDPSVLLSTHDKLLTARLLDGAGIPHPETHLLSPTLPWAAVVWTGRRKAEIRKLGPPRRALRHPGGVRGACRIDLRVSMVPFLRCDRATSRAAEHLRSSDHRCRATRSSAPSFGMLLDGEWRTNVALAARHGRR